MPIIWLLVVITSSAVTIACCNLSRVCYGAPNRLENWPPAIRTTLWLHRRIAKTGWI